MISFLHPEVLKFLWAVPVFILLYWLARMIRNRKAEKNGIQLDKNPENSRFTITNGWFICSVFCLVYAILIVGFASPMESEEVSKEYDSKEIQLMLAFDEAADGKTAEHYTARSRERIIRELDTLHFDGLRVHIGAISSCNISTIHTMSDNFANVRDFLKQTSCAASPDKNTIANTISECASKVKWDTGRVKNAIVILSDRENMSRAEIDAAKKAAKLAAKKHIHTYIIGSGPTADSPEFKEIINAGKGIYIEDDEADTTISAIVNVVKKNKRVTYIDFLNYLLLTLFFLITPALVIYLCSRYSWVDKIGPIIILYAIGMLSSSIKINGLSLFPNEIGAMQNILSSAMVPLAIPLMLYSCTFNKNEIGKHFTAMITGLIGVLLAVIIGYFICRGHLEEPNKIAGMMTGVYTGGTINMAAIKESLQADTQTYILIQTYDIFISLSYLVFLMVGGFKIFRKWLSYDSSDTFKRKRKKTQLTAEEEAKRKQLEEDLKFEEIGFLSIFTRQGFINTLVLLGITLGLIVLSAGITLLVSGGQLNMTIFFMLITTFGILGSYIKNIHNRRQHYNVGLYAIYIFSLVIATMADMDSLKHSLITDYWLPAYAVITIFGSLMLSAVLGKIFKVDADTMVITSVAYINSPALVPMISAAMRNRKTLIPGLTIGVVGFAVGNYLGTFLAYILP